MSFTFGTLPPPGPPPHVQANTSFTFGSSPPFAFTPANPNSMAHLKPKSAVRTVDPQSGCSMAASIYEDENGVVWNSMLNFTDISYGSFGCVH